MSITDVQRAFVRGLDGKGFCKTALLDYEDGGKTQRLSFHVVSSPYGAAYLSETIPSDMDAMQHARYMAQGFIEGRIGSGTMPAPTVVTVPVVPTVIAAPASAAAAPPAVHSSALVPAQPVPAPVPVPAQHETSQAAIDALLAENDMDKTVAAVCGWIDEEAGAVRKIWTNDHAGLALEYEQVRREINDLAYELIEATPEACPCLWASVGVDVPNTGNVAADLRAAATVINECVNATNDFLARVRAVRLAAKRNVQASKTIVEALTVFHAIEWPTA